MSTLAYLSAVSNLPSGQASSTTVTAQTTSGGAPATDSGATVGAVHETNTPGTYVCLVTYPAADLPTGTLPWVHWSVNGVMIDDPAPLSCNGLSLGPNGLDAITATAPTGVATTFPQMVVQTWRRFYKHSVKAASGLTIKTYADDNVTVTTTQTYTDDGAGNQSISSSS
jgi:hypothetical protein